MRTYDDYYNFLQQTFSEIFKRDNLMNQLLEPKNLVRRVATTHLLFLGDLNRFKAKFLITATAQA